MLVNIFPVLVSVAITNATFGLLLHLFRCSMVCLCCCVLFMIANSAKMAELIEMPFFLGGGRGETRIGPRNHVLDGGTYDHHLANMIV